MLYLRLLSCLPKKLELNMNQTHETAAGKSAELFCVSPECAMKGSVLTCVLSGIDLPSKKHRTQYLRKLETDLKCHKNIQLPVNVKNNFAEHTIKPPDHHKETQIEVVWTCLLFIRSGQNYLAVKGERRQGRQRKRWEDNIREWTGLEFAKSQRAVENRGKWKKRRVQLSVVPQRPSR